MKQQTFLQLLQKKKGFLLQVYACLVLELCITFFVVYYFRNNETLSKITKQSFILYLSLCIAIIIILTFDIPTWLKFLLFTIYAVVFGGLLHQITYKIDSRVITKSLLCTIGVFVVMTILGFILSSLDIDLSFMSVYILSAIIGLLVSTAVIYVTNNVRDKETNKMTNMYKILLIIGIIVFSIYITWSTSNLMLEDYNRDFVNGAMDLYLGFINDFVRMLALSNE